MADPVVPPSIFAAGVALTEQEQAVCSALSDDAERQSWLALGVDERQAYLLMDAEQRVGFLQLGEWERKFVAVLGVAWGGGDDADADGTSDDSDESDDESGADDSDVSDESMDES